MVDEAGQMVARSERSAVKLSEAESLQGESLRTVRETLHCVQGDNRKALGAGPAP